MRTIDDLKEIAQKNNFKLNSEIKIVQRLLNIQNQNKVRFGEYYCPCSPLRESAYICNPCKNAKNDINKEGKCHCNLFLKVR